VQRTDSETVNSIRRSELSANVQTVACSLGVNLVPLYSLDPIVDKRWEALVASHPRASVFHQAGWLKALAVTYDYKPLVLTSTPEGRPLQDGIVFAEIKSWITGCRLVSLPFADHCDPLLSDGGDIRDLGPWLEAQCQTRRWNYVELRPLSWELGSGGPFDPGQSFWLHTLSLTPSLEEIFRGFHANCMQRRIRRAGRAQLLYERGRSSENLRDFYKLLMITRRRHQLPPQPLAWFRNLITCLGPKLDIRVARKDGLPIAAIFTLRHGATAVYKYGCSDDGYHHLGAMPFLFWKFIEESKAEGVEQLDFGRTDLCNDGLVAFKDHFGTTRRRFTYIRCSHPKRRSNAIVRHVPGVGRVFSFMPDAISSRLGELLYRHIG